MSAKAKVALAILCGAFIFVVAVAGGYLYWLGQIKAELQESRSAGLAYGKGVDDNACWQEALKRQKLAQDYKSSLRNDSFFLACLAAASNPPGFCDGVPRPLEMIDSATWTTERCAKIELSKSGCQGLLRTLQTYCSEYYK